MRTRFGFSLFVLVCLHLSPMICAADEDENLASMAKMNAEMASCNAQTTFDSADSALTSAQNDFLTQMGLTPAQVSQCNYELTEAGLDRTWFNLTMGLAASEIQWGDQEFALGNYTTAMGYYNNAENDYCDAWDLASSMQSHVDQYWMIIGMP